MLLLCGFSQYIDVGNYNFVTPYAHDATHGIALSVAALVVLYEGLSRELRPAFLLSGLCFGGALLTKPEVGLALASAVAASGCAALWVGADRRRFAIGAVLFVIGAAVLPATFLIYFHVGAGMSWTAALLSVATGWTTAFLPEVAQNEFYRQGAGLDNPAGNVLRMSGSYVAIGLFVAAGLFLAWTRPRKPVARLVHVAFQLGLLVAATFAIPSGRLGWALPLVTATVSISMTARILRAKRAGATATIYFPLLMWAVFASAMLAKIALNARIYHYGFVLALPALSVTADATARSVAARVRGERGRAPASPPPLRGEHRRRHHSGTGAEQSVVSNEDPGGGERRRSILRVSRSGDVAGVGVDCGARLDRRPRSRGGNADGAARGRDDQLPHAPGQPDALYQFHAAGGVDLRRARDGGARSRRVRPHSCCWSTRTRPMRLRGIRVDAGIRRRDPAVGAQELSHRRGHRQGVRRRRMASGSRFWSGQRSGATERPPQASEDAGLANLRCDRGALGRFLGRLVR